MNKKRILLAAQQGKGYFTETILKYARKANWNVEVYDHIPKGWYGDGVILDSAPKEQIMLIKDYETVPLVCSRFLPAHTDNIRMVLGDLQEIAKLIADCLINRGFKIFASYTTHPPIPGTAEEKAAIMPDWALKLELEKRGHSLNLFNVCKNEETIYDFDYQVKRLRQFLRELPKPCACFTTNVKTIYTFYRACEEEQIKIPQEIAFLANNDKPEITENTTPPTSAIVGEIKNTALTMAKTLDNMLNGVPVTQTIQRIKPAGIVYRQSTDILAVPHLQTAQAINFLLTNYMNAITISDAADCADLHPDMMNYLFHKHVNKTPGRLLFEIRMNKAKDLLMSTSMSLGDIASNIGYGSSMSFYLAFKRENGITPGEYRNLKKKV